MNAFEKRWYDVRTGHYDQVLQDRTTELNISTITVIAKKYQVVITGVF